MNEMNHITTELPSEPPPGSEPHIKWLRIPGAILRAIYGLLLTVLASLGATVLLNPTLRDYVLDAIFTR